MTDNTTLAGRAQVDDDSAPDEIVARYAAGTALLRETIEGMTAEQLQARPIAGKMTSQEVVCHIVDADQYMADRMKRTIATDRPLLMDVESVQYLEPLRYSERDLDLDLRLLEVTREQMAADLRRLAPETWERSAVHSANGLITLRQLLARTVRHLENHAAAIDEKRAALGL